MPDVLWWVAATFALLAALLVVGALISMKKRKPVRMVWRLLWAVVFVAIGLAVVGTGIGIQGYRALTKEEVAVVVQTEPVGPKRFKAQFRFPDGHEQSYVLAGDELYVDARILKWHPFANILGLHTAYELDRVSGRYADVNEERQNPRTIFSMVPDRPVDLFTLRQRYVLLSPLLDAEYGSATFIAANAPAQYEVRVSTTGLLVRRLEPKS